MEAQTRQTGPGSAIELRWIWSWDLQNADRPEPGAYSSALNIREPLADPHVHLSRSALP